MSDTNTFQTCERANDLISFLYGELDERESRSFELHRKNCAACEAELAAFGSVRQSIVAWRDQSLASSFSPSLFAKPNAVREASRSALSAIRSFVELSPLWMRAATAFVSILFIALAGLAISHLLEKPQPPQTASATRDSSEQFWAAVNKEVTSQVEARLAQLATNPPPDANTNARQSKANSADHRGMIASETMRKISDRPQRLRQPLTRAEREQLAADLRLISTDDEDPLQLLTDKINQ